MAKILVERGRGGMRVRLKRAKPYQRERLDPESAPRRESIGRRRRTRYFDENLAPLLRFLRCRVGRRWDDVYSELCARIRPASTVQQHVRVHLEQIVATDTSIVDGVLRVAAKPLLTADRYPRFYVCPASGVLRERPIPRWRQWIEEPIPDLRWDGPDRQIRRIDGLWYAFALAPIPAIVAPRDRDHYFRRALAEVMAMGRAALVEAYGREGVYAAAKRQLGRREIARIESLPKAVRRVRAS